MGDQPDQQQQDKSIGKQTAGRAEATGPHVYDLGDEGRRKDMIKDDDKDVGLIRIASLQPKDGAFIRRTTGKWTYAQVTKVGTDSITFMVNPKGCTKGYKVKYWVSHIRTCKAQLPPQPASPSAATSTTPADKDDHRNHRMERRGSRFSTLPAKKPNNANPNRQKFATSA